MNMKIVVQEWRPAGDDSVPGWATMGEVSTVAAAECIAEREYDKKKYGRMRHPDGGPDYGEIRALAKETTYYWSTRLKVFLNDDGKLTP